MKCHKICVYGICKDEEKFVDQWMDSMEEADLVVVTDTGSTDGTVDKLRARGALVYVEEIQPWRFDVARNLSLMHVPDDVDVCVCTDLDEAFSPGWRAHLEKAWNEHDARETKVAAKTGRYLYNWSFKPDGTPEIQFNYFKVHERKGFVWRYPVHECLMYEGDLQQTTIFIEGMVLNHHPDPTKSRGSYLSLLEMAVSESPLDDRMTYYLGREYKYLGRWQDCIDTLKKHLSLPTARWNEERCASMRWIAEAYYHMGNKGEAYRWYYRAIAEAPDMRDPYVEFAQTARWYQDWTTVFFLIEEALKIQTKSTTYVNMGYAWDHTPYELGCLACSNLGMHERALLYAKQMGI